MASLKPVTKNDYTNIDGKANIKIRISHGGKVRYIKTPYNIEPHFLGPDGHIKKSYLGHTSLNGALLKLMLEYNNIIQEIGPSIRYMDISTLLKKLKRNEPEGASFIKYLEIRIKTLRSEGRDSYADSYMVTEVHLKEMTGKDDILFKEINIDFLNRFQRHLILTRHSKVNTIRIYLNNIRAIFNHAIDNEVIRQEIFPFRKFKIKQEEPEKRALEVNEIKRMMTGPHLPGQQKAVDIMMLSFFLIGINMKDLLYAKESQIKKGRLIYKRFKTKDKVKENISIKIVPQAMEIINKYHGEKYLLNFLDKDDSYTHFKSVIGNINLRLRLVAKYYNLPDHLSTYYSRHSWATIASKIGITEDTISHAFGHLKNRTTNVYISYDLTLIDKANEKVIKSLYQ